MAYLATKRFNYWSQLGILLVFSGFGAIIGSFASMIPLIGKIDLQHLSGTGMSELLDKFMKPENATALRWMQFISTLFLFFIPPVLYAWVCHKKPFTHLGFAHRIEIKNIALVTVIMLVSLPLVSMLQELTEMLPWSKATLLQFKAAEDIYNKQVAVIARMNNFSDYVISILVIAFLPALFEEILFRGALQNLLSRWFKMPVLAIILTAAVFSAIHGSYLGFLSRFALGFILGWVYNRTGNIWLNVFGHFVNNALAITVLYATTKAGEAVDPSKVEEQYPLWIGFVGLVAVIVMLIVFDKLNKNETDRPGEEVLIPGYSFDDNPFVTNNPVQDAPEQQ